MVDGVECIMKADWASVFLQLPMSNLPCSPWLSTGVRSEKS